MESYWSTATSKVLGKDTQNGYRFSFTKTIWNTLTTLRNNGRKHCQKVFSAQLNTVCNALRQSRICLITTHDEYEKVADNFQTGHTYWAKSADNQQKTLTLKNPNLAMNHPGRCSLDALKNFDRIIISAPIINRDRETSSQQTSPENSIPENPDTSPHPEQPYTRSQQKL